MLSRCSLTVCKHEEKKKEYACNRTQFTGLLLRPLLLLDLQLWKSSVKHLGGLPVLLAEITGNKEDTLRFQFPGNSTVYLDYYQIRNYNTHAVLGEV